MADRTSGKTGGCGTEGALRFEFTLARRIVSNTAASPGHQIIGLCAEPGIGGSKFIEELKAGFAREKLPVRFRNFGAQEPERATRTLVRFSNGTVAEASAPRAVVFLEGLPPSDEAHVQRQVRAIRKVAKGCAAVVVAVLPEAEQLLEELEEAVTALNIAVERFCIVCKRHEKATSKSYQLTNLVSSAASSEAMKLGKQAEKTTAEFNNRNRVQY